MYQYLEDESFLYAIRLPANQVRLALFALAYNLGNFLRRLVLPRSVRHWSLRSLQAKLIKIGAKVVTHSRRLIFQQAKSGLMPARRGLLSHHLLEFGQIWRRSSHGGRKPGQRQRNLYFEEGKLG